MWARGSGGGERDGHMLVMANSKAINGRYLHRCMNRKLCSLCGGEGAREEEEQQEE